MGKTRDLFKKIRDTKGTFHFPGGPVVNILTFDASNAGGMEVFTVISKLLAY